MRLLFAPMSALGDVVGRHERVFDAEAYSHWVVEAERIIGFLVSVTCWKGELPSGSSGSSLTL